MRTIRSLLVLSLLTAPARADIMPPASARIDVQKAEIRDLACSRRRFKLENTRSSARWFPYMGKQVSSSGWHPHSILLGMLGTVMLLPITVLAVPTDLVAAPFRKECSFSLALTASPVEWAGRGLPDIPVVLLSQNTLETGVPDVFTPRFFTSDASAVSGEKGLFDIDIRGYVGRDKRLGLLWKVKGHPGGTMRLTRDGNEFVLTEVDPGFGVGAQEMAPMRISPGKPATKIPATIPGY